jgi:CHAT domain-containing protein/Tfp pilus assembly protein PilF
MSEPASALEKGASKMKTRLTLVIGLLLFHCLLSAQRNELSRILPEVVDRYMSGGKEALVSYFKANIEQLTSDVIAGMAYAGADRRDTTLLNISLILAKEKGEKRLLATVLTFHATYYRLIDNYLVALEFCQESRPLFETLGDSAGVASTDLTVGELFRAQRQYAKALSSYDKALIFYRTSNDTIGMIATSIGLGAAHQEMGDNAEAIVIYHWAIALAEPRKAYISLARFFEENGDSNSAVAMYQEARPVADLFFSLGVVYDQIGEIEDAFTAYKSALAIYKGAGEVLNEGIAYRGIGDLYWRMGSYRKALVMWQAAMPCFEKATSPKEKGRLLLTMGKVYHQVGDEDSALVMYRRALVAYRTAGDASGLAYVYLNYGDHHESIGDFELALAFYQDAETQFQAVTDVAGEGWAYLGQATVLLDVRNVKEALSMYDRSRQCFELVRDKESQSCALFGKGEALGALNQITDASRAYEESVALLEQVRTKIGIQEMKISFLEKLSQRIEAAALFMLDNNYAEQGFRIAEGMKARAFSDQLAEKNLGEVEKGLNPELRQKKNELAAKLSSVQASLVKAKGEQEYQPLKEEYKKVEGEWETLTQQIRIGNPLYASVKYPQSVTAEELQKILRPEEALLEYFVSDSGAYVFVVTQNAIQVVKLPKSTAELENEDTTYCRNLQDESTLTTESKLYEMLIRPAEQYLKDKKVLVIVPDGFLTVLPFEAIIVEGVKPSEIGKRPKYLGEEYTIKYIQSATLLSLWRTTLKRECANTGFIGFGDPVYDYEDYIARKPEVGQGESSTKGGIVTELKRDSYTRAGGTLKRLEGSGREVEQIAQLFASDHQDTACYIRVNAREEQAKEEAMKKYGYILFSCHGLLADEFQSLVLSQIPGAKEDGYLTLDEIMNLDWNARLVVLSACETGRGKIRRGEGVIGLTRAVMYAGTPAAVVSLWSVSDEGTRELMTRFFEKMIRQGMSKEEALRQAKLEMLKGKFSNPYYWSAFVMYGE